MDHTQFLSHITELLPLKLSLIVILGISAQWLAWRLQWPAIVLMSAAGLFFGPFLGFILQLDLPQFLQTLTTVFYLDPDRDFGPLLRPAVALGVAVILFEGGLNLTFSDLRDSSQAVKQIILFGAPIGWLLSSLAAHYAAGLSWDLSALLGGLLVVTGPTVVLPLLRQAHLKPRPASVLKWEGIVNDPLGALFAVSIFELIRITEGGGGPLQILIGIILAALLGVLLGSLSGIGLARLFRAGFIPEYLKTPVTLATVLAVYIISEFIAHETGLVAATAMGMALANSRIASLVEMRRFKESIAIILVSSVFIALTANIKPDLLLSLNLNTLAFVLTLLFCVRPLTVFLASIGSTLSFKEKLLIGWIAPRGVVAIAIASYFATELALIGREDAQALLPLSFAIVFATVILHGFSIRPLAHMLSLATPPSQGVLIVGANAWSLAFANALKEMGIPVLIADSNWRRLKAMRLEGHQVFFGEVLSETADYRLDHSQFNTLIATTANEAYNALVCIEFGPELGRHKVFQLSGHGKDTAHKPEKETEIAYTARGRILGSEGKPYDALTRCLWQGWEFKSTVLSETYTFEEYLKDRGESPTDLFAEKLANGHINFIQQSSQIKGDPGNQILAFLPPKPS